MLTVYFGFILLVFATLYWSVPDRVRPFLILIGNLVFLSTLGVMSLALFLCLIAVIMFAIRRAHTRGIAISTVLTALAPLLFFKIGRAFFEVQYDLPLGLSYFTLMLLGFYFDCYRGTVDAVPSLREVATFSSFFPIISMGPVERFKRLGAQLVSARTWNTARASEGLFLICLGLSKKLVIGDRLAGFVFDSPRHALKFDAIELWIFMFVSFVQIYCDFSGFVDIARGYSKLLGIEIVDNFDQPYLSRNVPEIWRRWHISLVDWLRDFVYNPISLRTQNLYLATAAVMFSVGMWHNISWGSIGWATYWSLLYGASILSRKRGFTLKLPNVVKIAFTIGLISFSTFFFLPTTLDELGRLTRNLLSLQHFSDGRIFSEVQLLREDVCIAAIACFFTVALETWQRRYYQKTETRSFYLLLCFAVLLFMTTVAFGVSESQAFLYLRF